MKKNDLETLQCLQYTVFHSKTHHVYSMLKRHGNDGLQLVSTLNTRGVFVGIRNRDQIFESATNEV